MVRRPFGPGEANETILTAAGDSDVFVAKFDTTGSLVWAKRAGGANNEHGQAIALDGLGNSYVTGDFSGTATFGLGEVNETTLTAAGQDDIFVAKYDTTGSLVWAKRAGGAVNEHGQAIALDGSGNSYVTGYFAGTATFGPGEANEAVLTSAGDNDVFLAKYAASGGLVWANRAGGASWDDGYGIAVDGLGNSYITGLFYGTATFGLGEANETILTSAGSHDVFLAKYAASGGLVWANRAGEASWDRGYGIAVDGLGNSYITGSFSGTATFDSGEWTILTSASEIDVFVAKFLGNSAPVMNISSVDFDGDGVTDIAVYETNNNEWFMVGTSWGFAYHFDFGNSSSLPVPADYDGDGNADIAVYETSTGDWFYIGSTLGLQSHENFGGPGLIPVPGDYDGDGITDPAVYDTAAGHWFIDETTAGHQIHPSFGGTGWVPVPGDYDGDGKTDIAVYEKTTGTWCYVGSTSGIVCHGNFGGPGYVPVPGDYDGDGTADLAVYDTVAGHWFIDQSTDGFRIQPSFGGVGYFPVPGDYDGDGKTDIGVYDTTNGHWFIDQSTDGFKIHPAFWGHGVRAGAAAGDDTQGAGVVVNCWMCYVAWCRQTSILPTRHDRGICTKTGSSW